MECQMPCSEHSRIAGNMEDLSRKQKEQGLCLVEIKDRLARLEIIMEETRNLLSQYLNNQQALEGRMVAALERVETNFRREIEALEKRLDRTEGTLDRLLGGLVFFRYAVWFAATSGGASFFYLIFKAIHGG